MNNLLNEAKLGDLFATAGSRVVSNTINSMKNKDELSNGKGYSYSSIAKSASRLIAVFPVLTSRTVSPESAQRVSKYIEQTACQFIMLALQAANIDTAENGIQYLRKFHQNLNINGDGIEMVASTVDRWLKAAGIVENSTSSYFNLVNCNEAAIENDIDSLLESDRELEINPRDMNVLLQMLKEDANVKTYDMDLNPISINDYSVNESYGGTYHVSVKPYLFNEAGSNDKDKEGPRQFNRNVQVLKDQDIQKMNDAVPSLLVVKFYHKGKDDTVSTTSTDFIVGVKSRVIPVTTSEIIRRIVNNNHDHKGFLNFMRFFTGEKNTGFLINLAKIKDDVKSCKVKGAYGDIWNLLVHRAEAAKEQLKRGDTNEYSAITTLLISKYDADELMVNENIDIMDPKVALEFMESYNLLAFGIVDDSIESLNIMFDNGSKTFEEIAYSMLDRETKDGTYKKLINLMAASK